ncbi:MAG: LamG-like jellyroll fold domain-containing protein [Marinilabilia sp.]
MSSTNSRSGYALEYDGNEITAIIGSGGWAVIKDPIAPDQWYHVAMTYQTGTLRLYVNGELKGSSSVGLQTNQKDLYIGGSQNYGNYLRGAVDEVRIWNVARDQNEINANKDVELAGNEAGLVAYYNFNQGTAGENNPNEITLLDKTANELHGTLNNFSLFGDKSNWITSREEPDDAYPPNHCLYEGQTQKAWRYLPVFEDPRACMLLEESTDTPDDYGDWFSESFTIDSWIKPLWDNNSDKEYVFFSATRSLSYALYTYFSQGFAIKFKKHGSDWKLELTNYVHYNDEQTKSFTINYDDFHGKWRHLAVSYNRNYKQATVYIDGEQFGTANFTDEISVHSTSRGCRVGDARKDGNDDWISNHFYGSVSGLRIWKNNEPLNANEINYIYDKTFIGRQSFSPDYEYLFNYGKLNMYTSETNVYSIGMGNALMDEKHIHRHPDDYHAPRPPRPYNLQTTNYEACNKIQLSWEPGTTTTSVYIYRKPENQSGWKLLCRTNETSYTDDDPELEPGIDYIYKIESVWRNDNDPMELGTTYYHSTNTEDFVTHTARLKQIPGPENLRLSSTNNCNGELTLQWDQVNSSLYPHFEAYYVQFKQEEGNWTTLTEYTTSNTYSHNIGIEDYGKNLTYRVGIIGDGCHGHSNQITGKTNEECTTSPANVAGTESNGSILVTWDFEQSGPPASHFRVYRSVDGGNYNILKEDIAADTTEYTDRDAAMCKSYRYKVEAYNSCGSLNSTSNESNAIIIPSEFSDVFNYTSDEGNTEHLDASKGYHNNKVLLEWNTNPDRRGSVESYEIYRKKNNESYSLINTLNNNQSSQFEDLNAEPNLLYEYFIRATAQCASETLISDTTYTSGFRTTTGIINGKVTFEGGNAVPDVEMVVSSDEELHSQSLLFHGTNMLGGMFPAEEVFQNAFSVECWIKPEQMTDIAGVVSVNSGMMHLGLKNMKPYAALLNGPASDTNSEFLMQLETDSLLNGNEWYHLACTYTPSSGTVKLYLDAELIGTSVVAPEDQWVPDTSHVDVMVGRVLTPDSYYAGNIDEMRFWSTERTAEEIEQNYRRIIVGNESGLIGYYRFDEGFGEAAYDISKSGTEYNKNDLDLVSDPEIFPEWSEKIPSFEQLRPSGITDKNGNYTINGIVYSSGGNIFNITPLRGVHEFDPSDVNLFIGDNSPVHNNIDFTDISSFRVTGTVYYENTNFPVKDADVYINNQQVYDNGGNPVLTNEHGEFDIDVPIGENYIAIRKENHTFEHNGQWPAPTDNDDYPTHNFLDDVYGLEFYDQTRVKLAGRFVGGDVEGSKQLGFGLSNNNIGKGTIILENEQGFDIDHENPESNTSVISITTDETSGEYEVMLLPELYKINSVKNNDYEMAEDDLGVLDMREIPEMSTDTTTIYTEEVTDDDTTTVSSLEEYQYHFKRNFIIYSEPVIEVTADGENPFSGEKTILYGEPGSEEADTLDISSDSPFRYPLFEMGKAYDIHVILKSEYVNNDGDEPVTDVVYIENGEVTIANNLEINQPVYSLQTNSEGIVEDYPWFRAGLPNMNEDNTDYNKSYTKVLSITANYNNYNVAWQGNEDGLFRAYVLGGVDAGGQNFVTYGPEVATTILRDPPGSNSYTYLEKGSGFKIAEDFNFSSGGGTKVDNKILKGARFEAGGGLAGPVVLAETKSTYNAGLNQTSYVNKSGSFSTAYEFNQRFSTSAEPDGVGSMADVYIGKSYNMFFTQTRNLRVLPKAYCEESSTEFLDDEALDEPGDVTLGKVDGFAVTEDESSTMFIYSQDHIVNSLIPNYIELIKNLLETSDLYESKIPTSHPYYGISNDNEAWGDTIAETNDTIPSYIFHGEENQVDTIDFLNQQISIWMQTIALNEDAKVKAGKNVDNYSFDGNAGPYLNEVSRTTTEQERTSYNYNFKLYGGSEVGFSVNNFGFFTTSQSFMEWDRDLGYETEESRTMTWGYVLDDNDMSDYYSVDVKMDENGILQSEMDEFLNIENQEDFSSYHSASSGTGQGLAALGLAIGKKFGSALGTAFSMGQTIVRSSLYLGKMGSFRDDIKRNGVSFGIETSSPIFSIAGGRSSCPYEGPEETFLHLNPDNNEPFILHQGTQQREAPKIDIEPQTLVNVPAGEAAAFELKLSNESFTGHDYFYELQVDESTNPHGAVIKLDGVSPNRAIFVEAGETLTKTITVEQGPGEHLEYENLRLLFHSQCQFDPTNNNPDIVDSVEFTARFIPVCSKVEFGNIEQNWVVNQSNNDTLPVHITGYNINYPTFERIILQYQQAGKTPTTVMSFFNDQQAYDDFTGPKTLINGEPDIYYDFDVSTLNDGNYKLMLKTLCGNGSVNESDQLEGVIDRINPRTFGTPQPANGILEYGDDISVRFNETIDAGHLYSIASNISMRGITNGTDLTHEENLLHDASIAFDGENDYLLVSPGVNLDHTSFTIEFWAKRASNGRECLLSLNAAENKGLWVGFDSNDKFVVNIEGNVLESENVYATTGTWNHYALTFNQGGDGTSSGITAVISSGTQTEETYMQTGIYGSLEGPLYVARCPYDLSAFNGNMHELRIWKTYRNATEISSMKGRILSGYEQGLYSLWPMNEASGNIAGDIAFGRDAMVSATWQVSRDGKSLTFDGDSYAIAQTGSMVFDERDDFSMEFWFKTNIPENDAYMFSNGSGDSSENPNAWQVIATNQGYIRIENNGQSVGINADAYLNNQWHHFALTVNRLGYLSVFMNGELIETRSASNFKRFAASQMVLGARWNNQFTTDLYDSWFTGKIDELRIWNNCRKAEQIRQYMNHSLTGDEFGLKAYFPMEDTRISDPSVSNETLENLTNSTHAVADNLVLFENSAFSNECPNMKLQRPEVDIPFTYAINNDEVIISPDIDANLIENRTLNIGIRNVQDMFGNSMSSTATWTAFVNQNTVVWDTDELQVRKHIDDELTLNASIRNNSGSWENFRIENIPSWMEVSPTNGTLEPMEVEDIKIEIKPEINVGSYSHDIHLVSSMNYNESLRLNINVDGTVPEWNADSRNYNHSTNLIGQLRINDVLSVDTADIVACFVGDECRGTAKIQYYPEGNMHLLFMSIYSNQSRGEELHFKIYDASTGNIYSEVSPVLEFNANKTYGSISSPTIIDALNHIEQRITLDRGWNWISFNVHSPSFNNLDNALKDMNATSGDLIKNAYQFAQYTNLNRWRGTMQNLSYHSGYKIHVREPRNFVISGEKVIADTVSIALNEGWNLTGFPSQTRMPLKNALSALTPSEDDIIKSQHEFAVYNELLGWVGSLTYMEPGAAYMIKTGNPDKLEFTTSSSSLKSNPDKNKGAVKLPATSGNMSIIADMDIATTDNTKLLAYDGNVLCGYANPVRLPGDMVRYFVTINSEPGREIVFKAEDDDDTFSAQEQIIFSENAHLGSIENPLMLHFGEHEVYDGYVSIHPNPFSNELKIELHVDADQKGIIEMNSVPGKELHIQVIELSEGTNIIELSDFVALDNLNSGVYFIKISLPEKVHQFKVVKY